MTAATQAAEVSDDILKWEGLPCPGDCFSCPPMWEEPLCSDCPENRRVAPPPTLTAPVAPVWEEPPCSDGPILPLKKSTPFPPKPTFRFPSPSFAIARP